MISSYENNFTYNPCRLFCSQLYEEKETKLMMTMKKFMIIKKSSKDVMDCEHDNEIVTELMRLRCIL